MEMHEQVAQLAQGLADSARILSALGDETRQHLILEMLKMGRCSGVRVCEITEKTHLSRPAVSHHLQVMKVAGLVRVRREGTKQYYYFDPGTAALEKLVATLQLAMELADTLPDRSGEDD